MIVKTNENHGEHVVLMNPVTTLFTIINGSVYSKCSPAENSYIIHAPSVMVFFGNFMDSVKRKK